MLQDVKDLTAPGVVKGLNTQYNFLTVQKDQSPNMMDVKVNYDGSIEKRLGTNKMNVVTITGGSTSVEGFSPTTANILTSFVSYWNLNELSGNRADIVSGYTMSQSGGVVYADGKIGKASLFEATCSQFLRAASSNAFTGNTAFSYASWFYLNSTGGTVNRTILSKYGSTASEGGGGTVADANDVLVVNCDNISTATQFLDSSTAQAAKAITANGNATQLPIKFNKSAGFFNGTTDYVVVPHSADWTPSTGFTVEFMVMFNTVGSCTFITQSGGAGQVGWNVQYAAGIFYFGVSYDGTNNTYASKTITPAANTWYHITGRKNGDVLEIYVDAVIGESAGDFSGKTAFDSTAPVYVGCNYDASNFVSGWMKELRVSNIARTAAVPTAEYSSDANTKLLMHFDTPATSPLAPAIAFDGTGDYLILDDDADWNLGTNAFTIEGFFKWDTATTNGGLWEQYVDNDNFVGLYLDTNKIVFRCISSTSTLADYSFNFTPVKNSWYHISVVRDGTSFYMFLNGVPQSLTTGTAISTNTLPNLAAQIRIGWSVYKNTYFAGFLREFFLTNGTAKYTVNFTPSQTGFTVDANTKLYIKGNENNGVGGAESTDIKDSETTPKEVTCKGNTLIKYTEDYRSCIFKDEIGKFPYPVGSAKVDFFAIGDGVGYFDGANDYLSIPDSDDWDFGTGTFTVELYVRWSSVATSTLLYRGAQNWGLEYDGALFWYAESSTINQGTFTPIVNTWYHIAVSRGATNSIMFLNGTVLDTDADATDIADTTELRIGVNDSTANDFAGLLDNIRISKGIARYTAAFNPPAGTAGTTTTPVFEYSLYVNSNNLVTFDVSSSGTTREGTVQASSFGAVTTATWYNAICWYDSANERIGVVVNESYPVISAYTAGIISGSGLLQLGAENTSGFMDGRIDEVGFWAKALDSDARAVLYNKGSGNTYGSSVDVTPWASFDFGASSIRWLTVAAGTGVYASSNLGTSWVNIGTTRTANYQYFDRSKNVLVATSESYDPPLYWSGSAGTYALSFANSAPWAKYSINFSGYLIMLNSKEGSSFGGTGGKRMFHYLDANFQLSRTDWLNFEMPSSADDEITAAFILRRYLYVSTKYKIFRVSFVGGSPDWLVVEVKNWGFIPRTVKKIVISNQPQAGQTSAYSIGEVVVGLTWDRKIRIFDGSGDQILSNNVEKDNGMCEFALDKISYFGSGPILSFAEVDPIPNVYRLCVSIGLESSNTTHFLNYDARCQALYPYANMPFNTMCIAESANRQYLMAFDRAGFCHMIDSGNLDGNTTPINDYFESPVMFEKTPSQVSKGHKTDMFFSNTTSGNIYYEDRTDFSNEFNLRKKFAIGGTSKKIVHFETVDVPEVYNTYQFRISSSCGTSAPWRLQRYDHFTKGLGIGRND